MASAPRPSSRPRQTWRERSRSSAPTPESRLIKRWLWSILFVAVLGLLLWGLWLFFFSPRISLASLRVPEYERFYVPPVPFSQADYEALGIEGIKSQDSDDNTKRAIEADLTKSIQALVARPTQDSLVLYVSAHGISKDGQGYLLPRDFLNDYTLDGLSPTGNWLEIGEFLNLIKECEARHKIVVLDAGHLSVAPHLGALVNEFPSILKSAVTETHDESLWVLSANSIHEYSHVSYPQHRTAFSYFVVRGLAGDADLRPPDRRLDLAELATFVGGGVSTWVRELSDDQESQTPQIYWGGGDVSASDLAKRMSQVTLPIRKAKRSAEVADTQAPQGTTPPADVKPNDTKPGDTKPPDTKPDDLKPTGTKSAEKVATAAPRGTARNRNREAFAGPIGLATLAIMQQPAAEPSAAKNPPTDAAPTAAPEAAEKKKDAVPAADPASKAPAEAKGTPSADAAQEPKPQSGSPAEKPGPRPAAPPTATGPLTWIDEAWKDHDNWKSWARVDSWGPGDYAPHLWREFEQVIINYELRRRAWLGAADKQKLDKLREEFGKDQDKSKRAVMMAKSEFERSPALKVPSSDDDLKFVREAVQERNASLYRAVELVAWHARATCCSKEKSDSYGIDTFLGELGKFDVALEKFVARPLSEAARASSRESLAKDREALNKASRDIDNRINSEVDGLVKAPASPGAARRIEALLATSLLDSRSRGKLLALLDPQAVRSTSAPSDSGKSRAPKSDLAATGNELEKWLDENKADLLKQEALEIIQYLHDSSQRQSALAAPWESAATHAKLEVQLARLADHSFFPGDLATPFDGKPARNLGNELARFYLQLPKDISTQLPKASQATLRDLDRKLRLVPAAGAIQLVGRTPIPDLKWTLPEEPGVRIVGNDMPDELVLNENEWTELKLSLATSGGYAGRVKISVDYKKDQLRVKKDPEDGNFVKAREVDQTLALTASRPLKFSYFIQPVRRMKDSAFLTVSASPEDSSGPPNEFRIPCSVTPPDDVELVVSTDPRSERLVAKRARQVGDSVQRLYTFSGHKTPFTFQLRQQAKRERKLAVALFGVTEEVKEEEDRKMILNLLRRPNTRQAQLEDAGVVRLAEADEAPSKDAKEPTAKQMSLPKDGTDKPIPFKAAAPAPGADAKPAAPDGKDSKPDAAQKPEISGGLVCVVRDLEKPDLGPWLTWIDISPWLPRDFIEPRVSYSRANKELSVDLGLQENAPFPQDGEPVKVTLNFPPSAKGKIQVRTPEVLLKGDGRKVAPLKATNLVADQKLELRLDVDGYPRGFIFEEVALNLDHSNVDRLYEFKRIEIVAPKPDTVVRKHASGMMQFSVDIQVDAPENAFGINSKDQVNLVVAKRDDDTELFKATLSRLGPRQVVLRLDKIEADGLVTVSTVTSDFHIPLALPRQTDLVNLTAQLDVNGSETPSSVPIVLDDTPPEIKYVPTVVEVYKDDTATIKIEVKDEGSGPRTAELVVDKNHNGEIDEDEKPVICREETGGAFDLRLPAKELDLGTHELLVWATDQAGLKSYGDDREPQHARLRVKPRPPEKKPDASKGAMATTGSIKGQVLYVKQPVANAKVSIVEGTGAARKATKSVPTGPDGRYEIKDMPPGTYTLQAEGRAKNNQRKSPDVSATVPTPPATVELNINLQ